MPVPEMISGMRPPRTTRIESMAKAAEEARNTPTPATDNSDVTVYVSNSRRYLVEIASPEKLVDPLTGRKTTTRKRIAAEFDEGVYRNGARGTPSYRNPELRKLIDEALQANPYFGKFGSPAAHFWLASEQQAQIESKRIESALETLKSLPKEQVEAYAAMLKQGKAEDHSFEPEAPAPKVIRPIQ